MNTTTPMQQEWQQQQKTTCNNSSISKDNEKTATTKQQKQQWHKNSRDNTENMMIHNKCQIEQNNDVLITTMLQKSHKNGNSNDSDESRNINNRYQNRFRKSSPYYNPYKSSSKNKAKCYFRHTLQRSVSMAPLSSEYFSNNLPSVKGLIGKPWCPSSEKCSKRCCCIHVPYSWYLQPLFL